MGHRYKKINHYDFSRSAERDEGFSEWLRLRNHRKKPKIFLPFNPLLVPPLLSDQPYDQSQICAQKKNVQMKISTCKNQNMNTISSNCNNFNNNSAINDCKINNSNYSNHNPINPCKNLYSQINHNHIDPGGTLLNQLQTMHLHDQNNQNQATIKLQNKIKAELDKNNSYDQYEIYRKNSERFEYEINHHSYRVQRIESQMENSNCYWNGVCQK